MSSIKKVDKKKWECVEGVFNEKEELIKESSGVFNFVFLKPGKVVFLFYRRIVESVFVDYVFNLGSHRTATFTNRKRISNVRQDRSVLQLTKEGIYESMEVDRQVKAVQAQEGNN